MNEHVEGVPQNTGGPSPRPPQSPNAQAMATLTTFRLSQTISNSGAI
jgi:hypothetical protein